MDVVITSTFQVLSLLTLVFAIIGIIKLLNSENKNLRILGKVIIGILLAPVIVLLLLFISCFTIFLGASFFHI